MKKALISALVLITVLFAITCKKKSTPVSPAATAANTPNVTATAQVMATQTVAYLQTAGPSAQATATAQSVQATQTAVVLQTAGLTAQETSTALAQAQQETATALVQAQETATETEMFITAWGGNGTGNGQLSIPYGVAVDSSGNVYVADNNLSKVQEFNSTGTFIKLLGSEGTGNGQFQMPAGMAIDSSGNIYVAEESNQRIQIFSSTGAYKTQWEGTQGIVGIAVNSNGVYFSDPGYEVMVELNSSGGAVTEWPGSALNPGSGNGQFNAPVGVALDSNGNVYVADSGNNRIQVFNSTGTYITQWGSAGSGNGQFNAPVGIAVDNSGNVYVTDSGNCRVQEFNNTGAYLAQWGSAGKGNGQFGAANGGNYGMFGIACNNSGYVYVADSSNSRIEMFRP